MPATTQVLEGLWQINLGAVNAFLIDSGGLTLIDTGTPNSEGKIVAAIESIGKKVTDLEHIIVTHCHADHSGSVVEPSSWIVQRGLWAISQGWPSGSTKAAE